jgi:hypothetical protein
MEEEKRSSYERQEARDVPQIASTHSIFGSRKEWSKIGEAFGATVFG